METARSFVLFATAFVHVLAAFGVFGRGVLGRFYGREFVEPNLLLLMRHRGVLFGILGVGFAWAAFDPALHLVASVAGLVAVASFALLAIPLRSLNDSVRRVVMIDLVVSALLVASLVSHLL